MLSVTRSRRVTAFLKSRRRRRRSSARTRQATEHLEARCLLTTLVWSDAPSLAAPRSEALGVTAPNDTVYLLGGDSTQATAVPVLAPTATAWTSGFNIDTQRHDAGAVRSGNAVYVFGGTAGTEGSDEVLNYDWRTGDSQDLAKMNRIRYDFGSAVDGSGRVYAIGGIGVYEDGEIWSQAERYDPSSGVWTAIASLPQPRHGLSAIGDGQGHIFVFGGSNTLGSSGIQAASLRYDIATDAWSTIAPMPVPTRDSGIVADHTGALYITGGRTAAGITDAVQVYDPTTNSWSTQTPLVARLHSHAATFDTLDRILIAGGVDAAGNATSAVYRSQRLTVAETVPVITSSPVTSASLDRAYSYDVAASANPVPTYSLASSPAGMTIDALTGVITWQPVDGQVGTHSVTVRAANTVGHVDQTFDVTVVADTIAPTAPTDVVVAAVTDTSATLNWTASTDVSGIDRYEVSTAVYTGPRFHKRWVYTVVDTVTTTTSTITGLSPLSSLRLSVQAIDAAGIRSARSPRITATTLAAPTLTFQYGAQTSGTIQDAALHPLQLQLFSRANPAAVFSIVNGPAGMTVDSATGAAQWTPAMSDVGTHSVTFRATNSVGSTDLDVSIEVLADAPQLSARFNPNSGGDRFAIAGTPFTAQIDDASNTPSTYTLITAPAGMAIDPATGAITWTPGGTQGGTQTVTVRGTNAGGTTDLTFDVLTHFAAAVTGVTVTGTTQLHPTVSWTPPNGEGSDLISEYRVNAYVRYRNGRAWRTHRVDYTTTAADTSVELTGLLTGKNYRLTIQAVDAAGNTNLAHRDATVVSSPALPSVRWTVNGSGGGLSVPGDVIADQTAEVVLTPQGTDPTTITLISGPAGLTFNPATNTANWTPGVADVTSGYSSAAATFEATNSVGSVNVIVGIRVYFSGAVRNLSATRYGSRATATWDPPADNATPVAGYRVTRRWVSHGRPRSLTWTVGPEVTTASFALIPTGSASHRGVSVTPIDAHGNLGVSTALITFNRPPNDLPPIANNDSYNAVEDTTLSVTVTDGVRTNDIDTDNTPFINPLSVRLVSRPANGGLSLSHDGSFIYAPEPDFSGTDSFTYRLYDGAFFSDIATVTLHVAGVSDTPAALDDHYSINQGNELSVPAATGLLANDSDADGDVMIPTVVTAPASGTLATNADGSFVYTPEASFTGTDRFTYQSSDGTLESRIATVSINVNAIDPPAGATRFFVVDISGRSTFEYNSDGGLVETYALANGNRKPIGVTASADGSIVWTIDRRKRVHIYDAAGHELGIWRPQGLNKPEGIATDGTDIWIVDRKHDRVFHFAGAATRRNGAIAATSSFALDRANRNVKGITTDGNSLWVVNRGNSDRVFRYDTSGTLQGNWIIDPLNASPTGLTIDPNNVDNIWIVDSHADAVFEYTSAATRLAGSQLAQTIFDLDAENTNPQGIADPSPGRTLGRVDSPQPATPLASMIPVTPARCSVSRRSELVVLTEDIVFSPTEAPSREHVSPTAPDARSAPPSRGIPVPEFSALALMDAVFADPLVTDL